MATAIPAPRHALWIAAPLRYWHLFSLDAPCVAALWTMFLARQFGVMLPVKAPVALALAVWLLYVSDRLLDALHGRSSEERHRFHLRFRTGFQRAAFVGAPALLVLLFYLPPLLRIAWVSLTLPMAAYIAAVHVWRMAHFPKEAAVAILFASATIMPALLYGRVPSPELLCAALAFGGVCWLNCAAIARWEGVQMLADPVTSILGNHLALGALLVLPLSCVLFTADHGAVASALSLAVISLLLLDYASASVEPVTLRALADAALLTPLLIWPCAALVRSR